MQWIWIIMGLMLLMMAALLTWLLHRRLSTSFCHLKMPGSLLRQLRRTAQLSGQTQDVLTLQAHALQLMEQVCQLHHQVREAPALPASPEGEPRLMELARDAADADPCTPDDLLSAITGWSEAATSMEISLFPLCVGTAQCQRLALVLRSIRADAALRHRAERLAPRLLRSKKPYALLDKAGLNSIGLAALAQALRQQEQPEALVLLDRWLSVHDITAESLAQLDDQRQLQLAEELRRAAACLGRLAAFPWQTCCEQADALHTLLMNDPAGIYPVMDAISRQQLRQHVEMLGRRTRMDTAEIIRHALLLCEDAEPRALERYVGYWLQDAQGMAALRRTLPTRKGRLYLRFTARRGLLRYTLLWLFGAFAGFCFLHSGQPVFMLPFFLLVAGDLIRLAVNRIQEPPLPRISQEHIPRHVRTLVVLPALLHDQHEAIRMVRRLKTISHVLPQEGVEYLLLGDFPPSMTAISSLDGPIMEAGISSASALQEQLPLHYIQRGRAWDGDRHTYCARGGRNGAISELCRLIAQGECGDVIACATLEPAMLERRFDYVFILSAQRPFLPGSLERLLQTMTHPLCSRYPTGSGWRGFSIVAPGNAPVYEGEGLLQPDAYLEATDSLPDPALGADALIGELAGHISTDVHAAVERNAFSWEELAAFARCAWRLLPWQLPWVKSRAGIVNNPLDRWGRFRLREELRQSLLPVGQFALLLWAVLTQNWLLLLFGLAAPELRHFSPRRDMLLHALCRLSLLPARMLTPLLPLWDLLRRKHSSAQMTSAVEVWTQGLSATLFASLGLLIPAFAVPAFLLSAGFACFPLAHRFLETPVLPAEAPAKDHLLLLEDVAASTWRYFCAQEDASSPLPAQWIQYEPGQQTADTTSPEAIASALFACLCAKELGYITAREAADRLERLITALQELPLPFGLPCAQYALPSLTVTDARVSASSAGCLAVALMTSAQALRTWLPELPPARVALSAQVEDLLSQWDFASLYDSTSGLFHTGLDADGQPTESIHCLADEGLLFILAACARKQAPATCLLRLSRTHVRLGKHEIPLSRHGAAADHLLAGLFLPINARDAAAYIQAMEKNGMNGLFGQGVCRCWQFDAQLHYRQVEAGLCTAAFRPTRSLPVYAPYAAALALPFSPLAAAEALAQFCTLGAKGPSGFCDAVDFTTGTALVGLHDPFHQAIILASAAHLLADAPLCRYFCALPEVEACLPLLDAPVAAFTLPAMPSPRPAPAEDLALHLPVNAMQLPAPLHILGTEDFRLLCDAHGHVQLYDHDLPLNTALHFYLVDEGRTYPLGHPMLQGEVTFSHGEIRFEQLCGSLRCEVCHCADTLHRRAVHMITLTNLSTRDRVIELADLLLPDLSAPANTLECAAPEPGQLQLHARGTNHVLHHSMSASIVPLRTSVCTDAAVFIGRGHPEYQPGSLERPMRDHIDPSTSPCLSFRSRFALGGRGQLTLWFTTSLSGHAAPLLTDLSGLRTLAAMQDMAIDASAALAPAQRPSALILLAPLRRSGWQLSLLLKEADAPQLKVLLTLLGWLRLHGQQSSLRIHCTPDLKEALLPLLPGTLTEEQVSFAAPDAPRYPLVLDGGIPLPNQLDSLYAPQTFTAPAHRPPAPAKLPALELLHAGPYGGFDPHTLDYVIQLAPGLTLPAPWTNRHKTRHYQEETDESGLQAPFRERVWLRMADGTHLSPWSRELPRSIRMRPGETDWEAWSDQLDLRLRAACLPGHRCAIRSLHIHNATEAPLTLTISVAAHLPCAPLVCMDHVIMTDHPSLRQQAFLAGDGWQMGPIHPFAIPPQGDAAASHNPCALLTRELTLPPHRSGKVLWLSGFARHGEDIARALNTLRSSSASKLFRDAQIAQLPPLSALSFSTPEPTLDLLLNRILPLQALNADGVAGVPALMYMAPVEARRALLRHVRQLHTRDDWAHFILLAADYIRLTGNRDILRVHLPEKNATPLSLCRDTLLNAPLNHQQLPQGEGQARRCFLYALAAQALNELSPDPEALDFSRRLLNAADTYLWQDGYYGTPLHLDVQSLACAAYGANPRTRQAIANCWTTLYDQPHGLIRVQEATDAPPLPGLPENGGMITLEAVRCLRALLKTARHEEAFELLRALNPLHHTDTPERQAIFRCAPYQLHSGMCASPMEAGRAAPGGDEAAALLYAVILEDVLGVQLRGNILTLRTCVPADWEDFSFTIHRGSTTWHISAQRRLPGLTIDGEPSSTQELLLNNDGKVHHIRFPLA